MKFEQLMNYINSEVSKVMKSPLREPNVSRPSKESVYRTALNTDEEIDEILFLQDDLKKLEKEEKRKQQQKKI